MKMPDSLLAAYEPPPVTVYNANGRSPFLIVVDHASNAVPRSLGGLDVPERERERHIAWDIGIVAVSRFVADSLDATLVQQNYSRLVIDCNRPPGSETSIPETSELTSVTGKRRLKRGSEGLTFMRDFPTFIVIGSQPSLIGDGKSADQPC
jgi:predicted N-formylglutamate amidohydrolase